MLGLTLMLLIGMVYVTGRCFNLVRAIPAFGKVENCVLRRWILSREVHAKISCPSMLENVSIDDSPVNKNTENSFPNLHNFFIGQRAGQSEHFCRYSISAKCCEEPLLHASNNEPSFIRHRNNNNVRPTSDPISWRLTSILYDQSNSWGVRESWLRWGNAHSVENSGIVRHHVGTQLPLGGFSHQQNSRYKSDELKNTGSCSERRNSIAQAPTIKPLIVCIAASSAGFLIALWGGCRFDDGYPVSGMGLMLCGVLLVAGAYGSLAGIITP
jgi:hypothetical protein